MNRFSLLGIIIGLLVCMPADAKSPINLCLTGKVELILPEYKLAFLNAANLAITQSSEQKNIVLKTYFYDNKPLSAIRVYDAMLRDHCSAIVGFEYLSDLLLVISQQRDTNIPIFTSYASSSDSDKLPKNIFIFVPSYNYQAKKMMAFLHKRYGAISNALIITEIDRADLEKYKTAYESQLKGENIHYDTFDYISNDNQFEKKLVKFVSNKRFNFVFIFSGAVGSTKIINYMNDHKVIFIGTENFGSSTNQSLFVRLNDKKVTAYTIRNIDFLKISRPLEKFVTEYTEKYNISPSPLSAYTYDSVAIVLNTLKKHGDVNTNNVLKTDYYGITGASISNNQFHRSNQYVLLSIGTRGFVYEK